ncbi:MAG: tyrosine-type recombinase/integrase [Ruminococcus sp.]|uniref:tyrosine-type recombinase/integrase n=1 Tax=Ruminococcus sp. TaxID=41978 RepID=UPI0025EA2F05|nr:site-specific integrase [Ruminococcus sp.]MBR6996160.1 tyrosine-type recombinase/integrase [Ruminococcus sp.]
MANIKENRNKDGQLISFRFRVSDGYGVDGKQRFQTMTWKVPHGMTEKQAVKAAEKAAMEFEDQVQNGLAGSQRSLKLADFVPMYLDIKKDILAPRTYETYSKTINSLILPLLGHIKLVELKPAHIQQFIKYIQDNSKISPSTVKRKLAILQSILHQAVKLGLIQTNPANAERLTMPKTITPKVEIFTKQEAVEMLSCLEDEPLQYKVIVYLAIMSGAREGELTALKFSDVDFINNRITIERAAYKLKGEPVTTKSPKDNDVRTVKIDEYTVDLIRQLQAEKEAERQRLGTAWKGDEWLFTQWDGSIMYPATPSHWFRKFLERHGLKHRKFHALRHTSATLQLLGGVNIKQVSGRLGHADLRVTNQYLHCLAEADEAAANVLQDMLISKKDSSEQAEPKSIQKTG